MATGGAWCAGVQKADTVEAARMLGSPLAPFTALPDDGSTNFDTFSQLMLRGLCLDPLLQPFEMAVRNPRRRSLTVLMRTPLRSEERRGVLI